ncbi:TetR/AcrR family transcriptional regulator [Occultella kanbiaonis]|uniref:TetR/AcrR family transcriptional regulator n=1 Tax=Occultella kanbiaonis TaxID=2675754 RepID=UPI0013D2B936|nr:TetR family transcriptional regulator [Occultella kanbiaonis]
MRIGRSSGEAARPSGWADLTARARIRDAAIECFAEQGFDASVRTIAARAGVSPGLLTHHFGSKANLRAECDTEVLRRYREVKADSIARPTDHLLEALAAPGLAGTLLVYILRAVRAGGPPAREFLHNLTDDVRGLMAEAVASGVVLPSRDEEARLRYLTYQTIGALLIEFMLDEPEDPASFTDTMGAYRTQTILPTLELFTEGLLADRGMLDQYVQQVWDGPVHPEGQVREHPPPAPATDRDQHEPSAASEAATGPSQPSEQSRQS